MRYRTVAVILACGFMVGLMGCEGDEAASGTRPAVAAAPGQAANTAAPSGLRVWLDGQAAQPVATTASVPGTSNWRVAKPVSTTPRFKYDLASGSRLGRPTSVTVAIFRQNDGRTAQQADYSVYSTDPKAQAQIRPGTEYSLAKPGDKLGVLDAQNKTVDGVKLVPNQKYILVLVVNGNQAETAQVEFTTR